MEQPKGGLMMLVALVASKMEPPKPKFIDYLPEPRKKRIYKKLNSLKTK